MGNDQMANKLDDLFNEPVPEFGAPKSPPKPPKTPERDEDSVNALNTVFSQMKHNGQITPNIGKRASKSDLKSDTETDSQPALSQGTSSDIVSDNEFSKELEKFSKRKSLTSWPYLTMARALRKN